MLTEYQRILKCYVVLPGRVLPTFRSNVMAQSSTMMKKAVESAEMLVHLQLNSVITSRKELNILCRYKRVLF